jgi:hypothetical protein
MSIKKLQREIMLSTVYQLSTDHVQVNADKDSGNRLYWRANRQRMTAEQLRDSMLFVSGALDLKMGGPAAPLTPSYARRTIYGTVSRYRMDQFLQLFDFPAPTITAEQRYATNVPLQRLFLMNSDFTQQQAELLARKASADGDATAQIQKAYRVLFGRAPSAQEVAAGQKYLAEEPLRAYEEKKAEAKQAVDKKEPATQTGMADRESPTADMGNGMMSGVTPGAGKEEDKKKLLPVTALGRYIKVLLSSNEFLFTN